MSSAPATRKTPSTQVQVPGTDTALDLSSLSAHIAAELASGLSDPASVRESYGISLAQWNRLKVNPAFREMLADALRQWKGELNAGARIQRKADIVIEDAIPAYDAMIHSNATPPQARIEAGKLLAQLAGRGQKAGEGATAGGGFTLNINLGAGKEKLVIDGKNLPVTNDE